MSSTNHFLFDGVEGGLRERLPLQVNDSIIIYLRLSPICLYSICASQCLRRDTDKVNHRQAIPMFLAVLTNDTNVSFMFGEYS